MKAKPTLHKITGEDGMWTQHAIDVSELVDIYIESPVNVRTEIRMFTHNIGRNIHLRTEYDSHFDIDNYGRNK